MQRSLQLSPSDANAPTFAKITKAFFKNEGYFKRLFTKESWEEWTENRTPLGKVASQFRDCIESGTRVSKFTKSLNEREIQTANEEANALLMKLGKQLDHVGQAFALTDEKDSSLLETKNPVSETSPILSAMTRIGENILSSIKNLHPPRIVPSAIFAYSFSRRMHGQPTMMPAMLLSGIFSWITESNAQSICPSFSSSVEMGISGGRIPIAVVGKFAFFPSATSYVIRVLNLTDPFNVNEISPIVGFPNQWISDLGASEKRLVAWQKSDPSKLHIVNLECPTTSSSSSTSTTSSSTTSTSSTTSSSSSTSTTSSSSTTSSTTTSTSTTTSSSSSAIASSSLASKSSPQSSDTSRISSTSSLQTISSSSTSSTSVNEKTSLGNTRTRETPPEENDSKGFKNIMIGVLIGLSSNLLFTLPLYAKWFSKRRREKNGDSFGVTPFPISGKIDTAKSRAASEGDTEESTEEIELSEERPSHESPYQKTPDVVTNEANPPEYL